MMKTNIKSDRWRHEASKLLHVQTDKVYSDGELSVEANQFVDYPTKGNIWRLVRIVSAYWSDLMKCAWRASEHINIVAFLITMISETNRHPSKSSRDDLHLKTLRKFNSEINFANVFVFCRCKYTTETFGLNSAMHWSIAKVSVANSNAFKFSLINIWKVDFGIIASYTTETFPKSLFLGKSLLGLRQAECLSSFDRRPARACSLNRVWPVWDRITTWSACSLCCEKTRLTWSDQYDQIKEQARIIVPAHLRWISTCLYVISVYVHSTRWRQRAAGSHRAIGFFFLHRSSFLRWRPRRRPWLVLEWVTTREDRARWTWVRSSVWS